MNYFVKTNKTPAKGRNEAWRYSATSVTAGSSGAAGGGGVSLFSRLGDVLLSELSAGQFAYYNGEKWVNTGLISYDAAKGGFSLKAPLCLTTSIAYPGIAISNDSGTVLSRLYRSNTNGVWYIDGNQIMTGANILNALLTGYVVGTDAAVAATDTILAAIQKIQGQINNRPKYNENATITGAWRFNNQVNINSNSAPETWAAVQINTNATKYVTYIKQTEATTLTNSILRIDGYNNAMMFRVLQNGRVALGNIIASAKLHISNTEDVDGLKIEHDSSTNVAAYISNANASGNGATIRGGNGASNYIAQFRDYNNNLRATIWGDGSSSFTNNIRINKNGEFLSLYCDANNTGFVRGYKGGSPAWYVGNGSSGNDSLSFANYRESDINFITNSVIRATINADGSSNWVGNLTVLASIQGDQLSIDQSAWIGAANGTKESWAIAQINANATANCVYIKQTSSGVSPTHALMRIDSYDETNLLRVQHNGNIGIGDVTPSAKLHIYNTIGQNGLRIEQTQSGYSGAWIQNYSPDGNGLTVNGGHTSTYIAQFRNYANTVMATIYGDGRSRWWGDMTVYANENNQTIIKKGAVELYSPTPYIDFHYNGSPSDYTSRIIENVSGVIDFKTSGTRYDGYLSSNSFSSGFAGSGWKLDYSTQATLTVDNLYVRGSMNVYELIVNQIRATNGSLWVSDSCKATYTYNEDWYKFIFDDDNGRSPRVFKTGDIVQCQTFDGKNIKKLVGRVAWRVGYGSNEFGLLKPLLEGDDQLVIGQTYEFVRVGSMTDANRQGAIYLTSSDANAPFIDVIDGVYGQPNSPTRIRFIRDWVNGSNANSGCHWVEIKAINTAGVNIASGKPVTGSLALDIYQPITDGNTNTNDYITVGSDGTPKWVMVDLGAEYDINEVVVWHYYGDGRIYNETKTEVSVDGVHWYVVYNSGVSGTYVETASGKTHKLGYGRTKVRLGQLNGIVDANYGALDGYGLYAQNAYLTGGITAFHGKIGGWNINSTDLFTNDYYGGYYGGFNLKGGVAPRLLIHSSASNYILQNYDSSSNWGIKGVNDGNTVFQLGSTNQIAGWNFDSGTLWKGARYGNSSTQPGIQIGGGASILWFMAKKDDANATQMYYNSSTDWGIRGWNSVDGTSAASPTYHFGSKNIIANWSFDKDKLWNGGLIGSSTAGIELNATAKQMGINYNATNYIKTYYTGSSDWGTKGVKDGNTVFQLGSTNQIAGFNFSATRLWAGADWGAGAGLGLRNEGNYKLFHAYKDTSNYVRMGYGIDGGSDWGLNGVVSGSSVFRLGAVNKIAGFNFDTEKIYNDGVIISSSAASPSMTFNKTSDGNWNNAGVKFTYGSNYQEFAGLLLNQKSNNTPYISLKCGNFSIESYADYITHGNGWFVTGELTCKGTLWMNNSRIVYAVKEITITSSVYTLYESVSYNVIKFKSNYNGICEVSLPNGGGYNPYGCRLLIIEDKASTYGIKIKDVYDNNGNKRDYDMGQGDVLEIIYVGYWQCINHIY